MACLIVYTDKQFYKLKQSLRYISTNNTLFCMYRDNIEFKTEKQINLVTTIYIDEKQPRVVYDSILSVT